jgi:hypothetical protein
MADTGAVALEIWCANGTILLTRQMMRFER